MKIERAETVAYTLPFAAPYVTARGAIHEREMVLLRLRTDAGFEGERGYTWWRAGRERVVVIARSHQVRVARAMDRMS